MQRDTLLTIKEAAEMTRLSVHTLAGFRKDGRGPKYGKLGGRVFYREADIQAWIDEAFTAGGAK